MVSGVTLAGKSFNVKAMKNKMMIRILLFFLGNIILTSIMNAQVLKPRGITPNGPIFDMERMGNTLYVAGSFDKVGYSTGSAALIPIGDTLPNLDLPNIDGKVLTSVPDGTGGWYIGGEFTYLNSLPRHYFAHILPSMSVDTTFKPNPDGRINTLAIKDNKLYVGGGFTHIFGVAQNYLAVIDLSTKTLTSFNVAPDGEVKHVLINGSDLLVAGLFNHIAGTAHRVLAKINLTTSKSDSIPAPILGSMNVLLIKGDTLFAGGSFNSSIGSSTGPNRQGILAISLSNNTLLPWAPKVSGFGFGQRINALARIDSIIYMGGFFGTINGLTRSNFGAVNVSGSLSPFSPNPNNEVYGLATHNDSLYIGGLFTQISSLPRRYAVRFGKNSGTPAKWSLNPNAYVNSFAFDTKNLMVGGGFSILHFVERNNSCAFELPSLKLLPWKPVSNFLTINDVQTDQGLNRVYLVGYDSQTSRHLKVFDGTTGDSIAGWHPVFNNAINRVALDKASHNIYAAGRFTAINQISKNHLAVFDKDGNLLSQPFDIDNEVRNVVVFDTSVYICGAFDHINGQPRNKIGSLNLAGKVTNWAPQTNVGLFSTIGEIEALPDRVNVGGSFTTAGGQPHIAVAAFDPKTGNVLNWDPKLQATGRINWRRGPELNRRIEVLQTSALPLGYRALTRARTLQEKKSRRKY